MERKDRPLKSFATISCPTGSVRNAWNRNIYEEYQALRTEIKAKTRHEAAVGLHQQLEALETGPTAIFDLIVATQGKFVDGTLTSDGKTKDKIR